MEEKKRRKRRVKGEGLGRKKDKWWSGQGKGKYKTSEKKWKKSVHIVIFGIKGAKIAETKYFLGYLWTLFWYLPTGRVAVWIMDLLREQQMGHPSMELFLTTGHRMKIQFHSPQVNSANGIFCRTYLINWQKKGLKWNNVLLAILGKAKCAGRIFRFNPNSWIERVSIRECFRSRDRGWEIFGDRVWGRNNN